MNAAAPAPIFAYEGQVLPQWIDSMGHMNIACYVTAFDLGIDGFFKHIALFDDYKEREGHTFWVLELHLTYERELRLGEPFRITAQLLGYDDKRMQVMFFMHHAVHGTLCSTMDSIFIHVDFAARKSAPLLPTARRALEDLWQSQSQVPRPPQASRTIALKARRPAGA